MTVFIGAIVSMIITTILRGFVFQKFWIWFIMPVFHIQSISIAQSLGLMLIVGMATKSMDSSDEDGSKTFGEILLKGTITSVVASLFFLLLGFIIKSFV